MNDAANSHATPSAPQAAPMSPGKGLLVLGAVIVVIGAFLALNHALGIAETWVAFLFLLYWAGIEQIKFNKLAACIVGAIVGLLMTFLLQTLPVQLGAIGGAVFLGAVLVLVYLQIMGWLTVAVNIVTMLFLTVGTIPLIQSGFSFTNSLLALALGVAYFAGLAGIAFLLQKRSADKNVKSGAPASR